MNNVLRELEGNYFIAINSYQHFLAEIDSFEHMKKENNILQCVVFQIEKNHTVEALKMLFNER